MNSRVVTKANRAFMQYINQQLKMTTITSTNRHFSKTTSARSSKLPSLVTFPTEIYPNCAEHAFDTEKPLLNFLDTKEAYKSKSTFNLIRTLIILRLCGVRMIVDNADFLMRLARRIFTDKLVIPIIKYTFFAHFCAGEDSVTIKPTVDFLRSYHIGSILDYAAESDIEQHDNTNVILSEDEIICDASVKTFIKCIRAVGEVDSDGFAAIKFTALASTTLLQRATTLLDAYLNLYPHENTTGMNQEEFAAFTNSRFHLTREESNDLFTKLDLEKDNLVNSFDWNAALSTTEMLQLTSRANPVFIPTAASESLFGAEEWAAFERLMQRVNQVIQSAVPLNVKVMIDAEHRYFQTCIDRVTLDLQRQYNKDSPIVWATYQCYLKATPRRLQYDLLASEVENYKWGAKLVRGAYMEHERAMAKQLGLPSPVHETIEDTHASYNYCLDYVLHHKSDASVMFASHNQRTIEFAIKKMKDNAIEPNSKRVHFGQLLGMADHLSFVLGQNGYNANKYVPFGKVEEVIPYLLRRARENSNMLGGVGQEREMLWTELKRRFGF